MSRAIEHVTLGGEDDGRLVLGNAQIAASLVPLNTGWFRLRIGMRLAFEDTGGTISGTPRFIIGAMATPSSSMENGPLTNLSANFVGIRTNASTWTRTNNGGFVAYNTNTDSGWQIIHKAINSTQLGAGNITGVTKYSSATTGSVSGSISFRSGIIVDITKTNTTTFTVDLAVQANNTSASNADISLSKIKTAMEQLTIASAATTMGATYTSANGTISCDESSGSLNSICVAWDKAESLVHISDILWTHFSA